MGPLAAPPFACVPPMHSCPRASLAHTRVHTSSQARACPCANGRRERAHVCVCVPRVLSRAAIALKGLHRPLQQRRLLFPLPNLVLAARAGGFGGEGPGPALPEVTSSGCWQWGARAAHVTVSPQEPEPLPLPAPASSNARLSLGAQGPVRPPPAPWPGPPPGVLPWEEPLAPDGQSHPVHGVLGSPMGLWFVTLLPGSLPAKSWGRNVAKRPQAATPAPSPSNCPTAQPPAGDLQMPMPPMFGTETQHRDCSSPVSPSPGTTQPPTP